jgi:thiopurine S-methyltransferase
MDPEFWRQRWREGRIGFHQQQVTPLLAQYWDAVAVPAGARVLVPLCGKSLDMPWLAARGHRVLGVELSPIAIAQFFEEHGLAPATHESASGVHHVAGNIEIVQGDVFALEPGLLAGCSGVYDRAALIALPAPLRDRYVGEVYAGLPVGCRGLLVTLGYPPGEKQGPPFAVPDEEVRGRFAPEWSLQLLERRDILATQPGFVAEGVRDLHTSAWSLRRR